MKRSRFAGEQIIGFCGSRRLGRWLLPQHGISPVVLWLEGEVRQFGIPKATLSAKAEFAKLRLELRRRLARLLRLGHRPSHLTPITNLQQKNTRTRSFPVDLPRG